MLPSAAVGIVEKLGFSVFQTLGPFYTGFLLCAGVLNFTIETALHQEVKKAAKRLLNCNKNQVVLIGSVISISKMPNQKSLVFIKR